jgi:prepilin peptidase CpaA
MAFGGSMAYAAVSDLRTFEVPNWVSGIVVVSFLLAASTGTLPWSALQANLIAGAAVLVVGFGLFAAGWFGAGDAKLLSGIALWVGWPLFVPYLLFTVLAGGILTLVLIVFRRYPLYARFAATPWIERLYARKKDVPYAVAIGITALWFLPRIPLVVDVVSR